MNLIGVISCVLILACMVCGTYAATGSCGNMKVDQREEQCDLGTPYNGEAGSCCTSQCKDIALFNSSFTAHAQNLLNVASTNKRGIYLSDLVSIRMTNAQDLFPKWWHHAWLSYWSPYCQGEPKLQGTGASIMISFYNLPHNFRECEVSVHVVTKCGQDIELARMTAH